MEYAPYQTGVSPRVHARPLWPQANRPRMQSWLDSFGARYSRVVVAATAAALLVLYSLGVPLLGSGAERGALYRAMGLLTAASPCAVVLVPLAYVSAIAAVSRRCLAPPAGNVLYCRLLCGCPRSTSWKGVPCSAWPCWCPSDTDHVCSGV